MLVLASVLRVVVVLDGVIVIVIIIVTATITLTLTLGTTLLLFYYPLLLPPLLLIQQPPCLLLQLHLFPLNLLMNIGITQTILSVIEHVLFDEGVEQAACLDSGLGVGAVDRGEMGIVQGVGRVVVIGIRIVGIVFIITVCDITHSHPPVLAPLPPLVLLVQSQCQHVLQLQEQ